MRGNNPAGCWHSPNSHCLGHGGWPSLLIWTWQGSLNWCPSANLILYLINHHTLFLKWEVAPWLKISNGFVIAQIINSKFLHLTLKVIYDLPCALWLHNLLSKLIIHPLAHSTQRYF